MGGARPAARRDPPHADARRHARPTPAVSFGVTPDGADGPLDAAPQRARRPLVLDLRRASTGSTTSPASPGSPRSTAPRWSARVFFSHLPGPHGRVPGRRKRPRSRPCRRSTASSSTTPPACSTSSGCATLLPQIVAAAGGKPVEFHANNLMGTSGLAYVEAVKLGVTDPAHRQPADGQRPLGPLDRERRPQPRADGPRRTRIDTCAAGAGRRALPRASARPPATSSTRSASTTSSTSPTRSPAGWSGRCSAQLEQHGMTDRLDEVLAETGARPRASSAGPSWRRR